ncbi:MAG: helix-turn-helix domain-containing protein [Chroococcidiopsis sp.]
MSFSLKSSINWIDQTNSDSTYPLGANLLQHQKLSTGIDLTHYRHPPTDIPSSICPQHLILIHTDVLSDTQVEQLTDGHYQSAEMKSQDVIIIPARIEHSAQWNREHSYLMLRVADEVFQAQLGNAIVGYVVELLPQFLLSDPLIYSIAMALKKDSEASALGGQLYVDSLLTTLFAHLLRNYCASQPTQTKQRVSLPKDKLRQVLDFMHAHLDQNIALSELAAIAQVSPNYFAAQFKCATGMPPHQYLILQRIEQAKVLLIREQVSISDVAAQLGFAHQSHFTKHFKRVMGVTPKQFLIQQ